MSIADVRDVQSAARLNHPVGSLALPGAWHVAAVAGEVRIMTLRGPRPAHLLSCGDTLLTVGDGPQPILWRRCSQVCGETLSARPDLQPISLPQGSLGLGAPRQPLRLSPKTGVLMPGSDTLAYAGDLNGRALAASVTYVQFLLPRHSLIAAEGVVFETLHPARLGSSDVDPNAWAEIAAIIPDIDYDPWAYGPETRARLRRAL